MNRDISNEIPDISDIRLLDIDTDAEWARFSRGAGISKPRIISLKNLWKVAASIIILAGASILAYTGMQAPKAENYASTDKAIEATVETSTRISLNKNSQIACTDNRGNGEYLVELKGEAYFDVEKNPERTFLINTQDITVTVHGTSFDVCESADATTVTVTSGNVEVKSNISSQSVKDLTKGKQLICRKNGQMEVREVANFNNIAWKLRKLEFCNTSISEIMKQLSQTYDFKYQFADPSTANTTITGVFDNQELQSVFAILEQALDLSIERQPDGSYTIGK